MALTAPERETVITGSDADPHVTVWTAQRRVITKLKKNPSATLVDEGFYGTSAWARFEMPADFISFRSRKRQLGVSEKDRLRDHGASLAARNSKT